MESCLLQPGHLLGVYQVQFRIVEKIRLEKCHI